MYCTFTCNNDKINYSVQFNSLASFLYEPQVKGLVRVYHPHNFMILRVHIQTFHRCGELSNLFFTLLKVSYR